MEASARIIGDENGLRDVVRLAKRLARVDATVLVSGETGVGKEVFARTIHAESAGRDGPFVALNCGALSRELLASELFGSVDGSFAGARRTGTTGKIEAANGGTLFLDEVAELPLDLQPHLLRVLEGGEVYPMGSSKPRKVSFRLISACNRPLRNDVAEGRFRMDLFYRLSVTSLNIPPLRHRRMDIPELVEHFAESAAAQQGVVKRRFSDDVLRMLMNHNWPGNVRELRNVIDTITRLAGGEVVDIASFPSELLEAPAPAQRPDPSAAQASRDPSVGRVEKDAISAAILTRQGNLAQVARDLNISRSTLYLKLKKHALDPVIDEARLGG